MADLLDLHRRRYPEQPLQWHGRFVFNWFSNFEAVGHPVTYRGLVTDRLEIAFVAAKNPNAPVPDGAGGTMPFLRRIAQASGPGAAKRLGRPPAYGGLIEPRPDWDDVSLACMDALLRQRWQPGHSDAARLMAQPAPIVEWNNWHDARWGVPIVERAGRNALGLLLEVIAAELRQGRVAPGAAEQDWPARQAALIVRLNALQQGRVVGAPPC